MQIVLLISALLLLGMGNVVQASVSPQEAASEKACPIPESEDIQVIEKSVVIDRSRKEVYAFWRDPAHLPEYMERVQRVQILDPNRSQWHVGGPLGIRVLWDVQILADRAPYNLAWCAWEDARIRYLGSVRFMRDALPGATRAIVRLKFRLPAPPIRVAMALSGVNAEAEVETVLHRLKGVLERT
ncbi:MAG: SRPBCC family protein [Nitrospirota bacterium]